MHPQIEKLEQLFSQGKSDPAALNKFFDNFWIAADSIPPAEKRMMINKVLEWCKAQNPVNPETLAISTLTSALVTFFEGNFEASLVITAEAHELFTKLNDTDGVYATIVHTGNCYRSLGEMELALKNLLEGYQYLSKRDRFKPFQSFSLYMLGGIYSDSAQYDEALKYFGLCEQLMLTIGEGSQAMLCRVYNGIGVVYQHQKRYSLGLEYLNRSLKLSEEMSNLPVMARGLTDIGSYYFEMGDYASAAEYQQKALKTRNELKIQDGAATNMMLLAEIASKAGKNDEAIEWLNKALLIADELKVKQKMFKIHLMLSEIYQAKGDLMKSLFHHKAYHSIREEVQHEDNEKKIKNLQKVFEAEQTAKENVIIKAQKAEIEQKNEQLSETIHELTITKVSRKAKILTFIVGITLIIAEDPISGVVLQNIGEDHYWISMAAKVVIILSLKPIDSAIESYLLRRIILKKKAAGKVVAKA